MLMSIHSPTVDGAQNFGESDFRATSISDGVCVSVSPTKDGLRHLFHSLEALALAALEEGGLVRGGVAKARLYHDDKLVFGEGLVRAYHLESQVARYPRIVVERQVALDATAAEDRSSPDSLVSFLEYSLDGPRFLHVLRRMRREAKSPLPFNIMAAHLQKRFDEAADNPSHFEKVMWFVQYWNRSRAGNAIASVNGYGAHLGGPRLPFL